MAATQQVCRQHLCSTIRPPCSWIRPTPHHSLQRQQRRPHLAEAANDGSSGPSTPDAPAAGSTAATSTAKATTSSRSSSESSTVPPASTGFLSSSESQSAAYAFLTATSVGFALLGLAAPQLLLQFAAGVPGTQLEITFTQIAGATMAISAAAEYSLMVSRGLGCVSKDPTSSEPSTIRPKGHQGTSRDIEGHQGTQYHHCGVVQ